jgi:hypothetical protein
MMAALRNSGGMLRSRMVNHGATCVHSGAQDINIKIEIISRILKTVPERDRSSPSAKAIIEHWVHIFPTRCS